MTHEHQALLFLPDALRDVGVPFAELTGWKSNQQGYYWVDENGTHRGYLGEPNGAMWHHTATQAYTPSVRNAGRTVANIYIGIWRNGRLWSFGGGEPLVVLASGGPANYSSGQGRREVLTQYVVADRRFPGPQKALDDANPRFWGNRYYINTEVIHPGDGSALEPAVWDLQVETAAVISKHFGWSHWRNIAHQDHTRRKIDQRVAQGAPYTIRQHQADIRVAMEPPPPPPPTMEDEMFLPMRFGDGFKDGEVLTYPSGYHIADDVGETFIADRAYKRSDVRAVQGFLRDAGATVNTNGKYTVETAEAIMAVTPATGADTNGYEFHGNDLPPTLKAAYGS